jgi:excisionase family DNA binding protein
MENHYSNIDQVAEHYQVSKSTVRSWIRGGTIPFIRVGGMYRFRMSEVDAAFVSSTRGTSPVVPAVPVVPVPVVPVVPVVEQAAVVVPVTATVAAVTLLAALNLDQDA